MSARVAWAAAIGCVVLAAVAGVLAVLGHAHQTTATLIELAMAFATLGFPLVGAAIAARQPRNAIGWILLWIGVSTVSRTAAEQYALYGIYGVGGGLFADHVAALWAVTNWIATPVIAGFAFLAPIFPDGRFRSRPWRYAAVVLGVLFVLSTLKDWFHPGGFGTPFEHIDNPVGVGFARSLDVVGTPLAVVAMLWTLAAAISLVRRTRRARGEELEQLRWFLAALGLAAGLGVGGLLLSAVALRPALAILLFGALPAALVGVPLAIGVAILRYRLYDIDVVIRKTLVYGALTAVLVAVYLAGVSLLGALLRALMGQSGALAVTLTTLAVAALFRPALRRIQRAVDRRFYRGRYDGALALRAFAGRLREHVDLGEVEDEVLRVVDDTLRPVHAALWLRPAPGGGR